MVESVVFFVTPSRVATRMKGIVLSLNDYVPFFLMQENGGEPLMVGLGLPREPQSR